MVSAEDRVQAAKLANDAYADVERQDFRSAKTKLEQSLRLADDCADAHSEYALVLVKLQLLADARPHILRAIEIEPDNPKFWLALANWHFREGKFHEASRCVLVAERIDPNFPTVPVAKMHILAAMRGDPAEVRRLGEEALQFYNRRKTRADGSPLRMGDVERFLTLGIVS